MITKRQIQAALKEAVFTPSKDPVMKIVIDVGSYEYYIRRSIELLNELLCADIYPTREAEIKKINMVLKLIALAKIENE